MISRYYVGLVFPIVGITWQKERQRDPCPHLAVMLVFPDFARIYICVTPLGGWAGCDRLLYILGPRIGKFGRRLENTNAISWPTTYLASSTAFLFFAWDVWI